MSKMQLDIVTPEKKVYSNEVDMVLTRAAEGDIGILPKHAPLVSPLKPTVVRIKNDGQELRLAIGGGFLEVRPEQVTILAESAELAGDIDFERALAAKERAEERLEKNSEIDRTRAELALNRAVNRINVTKM
ncbi:F0F1 ATP synthase subunit epsilon [Hazenella sp. IB182357]|uniref:ATP synthase epsilon chain n=1 Tax=Polycladospora coralii TaxID=2771432 RepID=A0A926RSZ1_9BACL|nr:F0F1 ATP synthase subunit epsilon [Polycladospora coralii]MBD1372135.1 F0F1 ATP synthase subunit epsilon [Polycladospora coralii]MBS7530641.1 F0F1 ATP synthase subunit epsilon [Polycladospora coralii]